MTTIDLKHDLNLDQEWWLQKNVGPKLYHLHYKYGGKDWTVVRYYTNGEFKHNISFNDENAAILFKLRWS